MSTKQETQKSEEARRDFLRFVKMFQPTAISVVSLGSEVSRMMKEENRQKHLEALKKRAIR